MNQKDFIEKFHALLPKCQPEAAQPWCDFAVERVEQQQYVHFKAAESRDASVAEWLEVLYKGLHQIRETFGAELAVKVAALSLERCCLYPGEMTRAAECLQAGDSAKDILAKIASGEIDCTDLFSAAPPKTPPEKTYMSEQKFTAHMDELIPTPSSETNRNLLDLANSLWFEMKDDLYHAFSFVSRHFTPETLQNVYNLCGTKKAGLLPWEIIGAAVYLQTGTPGEEISVIAHEEYPFLHRIRALRDVASEVKTGDLGGFVEHEGNLSYEDADSWIYNDAIAANGAFVYEGAVLRDHAVACGEAHICKGAVLSDRARAEDHAHMDGGRVENYARLSGHGLVSAIAPSKFPILSGECTVYGIVAGNVLVTSQAVVLGDEKIAHDGLDQLVVTERGRCIQRSPDRDKLLSSAEYFGSEPSKRKPRRKQKEAER